MAETVGVGTLMTEGVSECRYPELGGGDMLLSLHVECACSPSFCINTDSMLADVGTAASGRSNGGTELMATELCIAARRGVVTRDEGFELIAPGVPAADGPY